MQRYWTRIALGALLVFCLGFAGLAVVRKGKAEVRNLISMAATRLPLRFANLGFRLGGRHLGELTRLDIVRKGAADIGRITGHVQLTEPGAAAELADCSLSLDDPRHLGRRTSFFCAAESDLESGRLVEVGEILFQPGAFSRPFYLQERFVAEWQRSELQGLDASLARDGRGGLRASGSFDLLDRGRGSQRGSFDLQADSQGALLQVRDEQNRSLVDFRASHGAVHLKVRDRQGRGLLRLLADSLGTAMRIDK